MGGSVIETTADAGGGQIKGEVTEVKNLSAEQVQNRPIGDYNPPKIFASVNLADSPFPKALAFVATIAEIDLGGFAKFLDAIVQELIKDVTKRNLMILRRRPGRTWEPKSVRRSALRSARSSATWWVP
jgi:hypothetical protein